jgi:5-methylcytosine-specific restriction endonuclease McrA
MSSFQEYLPTNENYWRALILFGSNTASYKFALGKTLLHFAELEQTHVSINDLSIIYSQHICDALERCSKQTTSKSSKFLSACEEYNAGTLPEEELLDMTARHGFRYVLDKFHNLNGETIESPFYVKGDGYISLSDNLIAIKETPQFENLSNEIDARWRLVEPAGELNLPWSSITVSFDEKTYSLFTDRARTKRRDITGCREALNGYQKGKCFYCFDDITVQSGSDNICEVDHFFPHVLKRTETKAAIDGVWNLVLACPTCNGEKSAKVPDKALLERLNTRNEFFISSHHPLKETIIAQTGKSPSKRRDFLQKMYNHATAHLITSWSTSARAERAF